MPQQANDIPEEPKVTSEQLDFTKIPEGTVTVIIKNIGGEVMTTGLTLPEITKDTPDEDLVMALQRCKDVNTRLLNTVFYSLAQRPKTEDLPELS